MPNAPGEVSVQPSVMIGVAASPAPHIVSKPVWQRALAIGSEHGSLIASDANTAYFSSGGHVCAVALANGSTRWCTGSTASSVALAGGALATAESDGIVRGRDTKTGGVRWQRTIGPSTGVAQPSPSAGMPNQNLWTTGTAFLAEVSTGSGTTVEELNPKGDPLWTWSIDGGEFGQPLIASPYAVFNRVTSGAITESHPVIVKLGSGGGEVGMLVGGSDPIAMRPPKIYSLLNQRSQVVQDYGLTFDVSVGDVRPGIPDIDWHYQPDYDENSKLPYGTHCCGVSKWIGIEGDYLYGSVFEHVYRYDLAPPDGQRPILMSDAGLFVAGPYGKRIYVGRPDGVWSVSFNGRYTYQLLVVPYRLPTVLADIAFTGGVGYAALTDGHIFAFQVDGGQPVINAHVPCSAFAGISVTQTRVLYACAAPSSMVYAFPR